MNILRLLLQNIRYYRKEHLMLMIGLIISTAVLTSALIIGDSIQFSLRKIVDQRIGNTQHVIVTQEHFFPADYALTLSDKLQTATAPVLLLRGSVSAEQSTERVPGVQIIGINGSFAEMGNSNTLTIKGEQVILNRKTATRLGIGPGDDILLRIEKARFVTDNAPFVPDDENSIALRLKVHEVIDAEEFGNFNIQTDQITPYNVFIDLELLSKEIFGRNYANLMLIGENTLNVQEVNNAISESWSLEVMNLELHRLEEQGQIELRSDKIFLEDTILQVLRQSGLQPEPVLSYLINFIHANERYTPYSFVSAKSAYPEITLQGNDIMINEWLANDLALSVDDTLELEYFIVGPFRKLITERKSFVVRHIVPVRGFANDPFLMPAFEGLAGVESCSDWNAGIPMEFSKIRDKDEDWWTNYRGTPKAFIAYETGVSLWGMEFGNSTAIRFSGLTDPYQVEDVLLRGLQPANIGMNIFDLRNDAQWSAANAVDFAGLFLALSFFLILAAFLLSGLLFSMMMMQRTKEQGTFRSLGISDKTIKTIFFSEGMTNALASSILGVLAGIGTSYLVLHFLNSIWFDIVRTSAIDLYVLPTTLLMGGLSTLLIAMLVIHKILRRHFKRTIGSLQKATTTLEATFSKKTKSSLLRIAYSTTILFIGMLVYGISMDLHQNSTLLFMSGFVVLVALLAWIALWIQRSGTRSNMETVYGLALRHLYFDWRRNLSIIAILSIGIFIVISTGANRVDFSRNATENSSGTGGFSWFVTTQIGLKADLASEEGREKTALDEDFIGLNIVQMHRFESDDASCLNLNRVLRPSVLGVDPGAFSSRDAFSFVKTIRKTVESPWELLNEPLGTYRIPAIADQTVITWGLGMSVGDSLTYLNERGDTLRLILVAGLANSVFQGHLMISEEQFLKHFPSISGSKVMLAGIEPELEDDLRIQLEGALRNYGVEIQHTGERLAMFNSVTNTYLDIFLAMGGIALILGTLGIAILMLRSIHSRRGIYAMMQAVGISRRQIQQMITLEYIIILLAGMVAGLVAAVTASLSGLLATGAGVPYGMLIIIVVLFKMNGLAWVVLAGKLTVKERFRKDLRNE